MEDGRFRKFWVLLYPDARDYDCGALIQEMTNGKYEAVYILHEPEEEGKKFHYHCILSFKNAKTVSAVSKDIGVDCAYIRPISGEGDNGLDNRLLYMIHFRNDDKKKYSIDDVGGSSGKLLERLKKLAISYSLSDEEILKKFSSYILESFKKEDRVLTLFELLDWACEMGYIVQYKKYYIIIRDLLTELKNMIKF